MHIIMSIHTPMTFDWLIQIFSSLSWHGSWTYSPFSSLPLSWAKIKKKGFGLANKKSWVCVCRHNRCAYNNLECACSLSLCKNVHKEEEDDHSTKRRASMSTKRNVHTLNESRQLSPSAINATRIASVVMGNERRRLSLLSSSLSRLWPWPL